MTAKKVDWQQKRVKNLVENFSELDDKQQIEVLDAIKYNYALQAAKEVGMTKTVTFGDMYESAIQRQKFFNKYEGFGCGLPYFDQATMGFRGGELIVIAAPSNFGKTMVAMNIVANIAANTLKKVVMITMEMTPEEVSTRLFNMIDKKDHESLKQNFVIQTELSVSAEHVKAIVKQHKPDILLIDHLGFLAKQEPGTDERAQIDGAMAKIKRLAINENIPIIMISHVSKSRSGASGEATVQDLKGSSAIEQDSDLVFMLNKPKDQFKLDQGIIEVVLKLEKHRTKSPRNLFHKKVLIDMKGVRTDGTYSLYN
jgi:replicative DNA helicase